MFSQNPVFLGLSFNVVTSQIRFWISKPESVNQNLPTPRKQRTKKYQISQSTPQPKFPKLSILSKLMLNIFQQKKIISGRYFLFPLSLLFCLISRLSCRLFFSERHISLALTFLRVFVGRSPPPSPCYLTSQDTYQQT